MNRYLFLLISLLAWIVPQPQIARAEKAQPIVYQIDETLKQKNNNPNTENPNQKGQKPNTKTKPQTPKKIVGTKKVQNAPYGYCSCVIFVKAQIGYTKPVGLARNFPVNSHTPTSGAVIVTYESRAGHVGIVSHFDANWVYLKAEANYSRCEITYGRKIAINSKLIKGYFIP